jgi:hypothetical protein
MALLRSSTVLMRHGRPEPIGGLNYPKEREYEVRVMGYLALFSLLTTLSFGTECILYCCCHNKRLRAGVHALWDPLPGISTEEPGRHMRCMEGLHHDNR